MSKIFQSQRLADKSTAIIRKRMAISWPADFKFWKLQKMESKKFLQHNASNKSCLKIRKIGPKSGSSKKCLVASFFREKDAFIRLQQVVSKLKLDCNKMPAASLPQKTIQRPFEL